MHKKEEIAQLIQIPTYDYQGFLKSTIEWIGKFLPEVRRFHSTETPAFLPQI